MHGQTGLIFIVIIPVRLRRCFARAGAIFELAIQYAFSGFAALRVAVRLSAGKYEVGALAARLAALAYLR